MKNKILVIIPAYNEEESIGEVINDIPKELVSEIVVVNNNSTDKTTTNAESAGATVVNEMQMGYGYACLKGIKYAQSLGENERPDIIVFLDGDYSDYPEDIRGLVKPIIENDIDMVIGSRTLGNAEKGALLPQQVFGNWLATTLISFLYGLKFTDLGPFRAIKFNKLLELNMVDKTYGWTVEMQIKAAKQKFRCTEVPVNYRKRIGVSKITGTVSGSIKAGHKILWTIFKYL
ncbi:MAG: glycosyltransferase family 2 protein [Thermodesulfobacteriota bacterium]